MLTLEVAGGQTDDTDDMKIFDGKTFRGIQPENPYALRIPLTQFLKLSLTTQITSSHNQWDEVICVGKLKSEDFGCGIFFNGSNTLLFFGK